MLLHREITQTDQIGKFSQSDLEMIRLVRKAFRWDSRCDDLQVIPHRLDMRVTLHLAQGNSDFCARLILLFSLSALVKAVVTPRALSHKAPTDPALLPFVSPRKPQKQKWDGLVTTNDIGHVMAR